LCRLISLKFSIPAEAEIEKPNGFWLVSLDCQRAGHPRPAGRTTDEPQSYRNISFMSTLNLPLKFSRSVEIFPSCEFRAICIFSTHFTALQECCICVRDLCLRLQRSRHPRRRRCLLRRSQARRHLRPGHRPPRQLLSHPYHGPANFSSPARQNRPLRGRLSRLRPLPSQRPIPSHRLRLRHRRLQPRRNRRAVLCRSRELYLRGGLAPFPRLLQKLLGHLPALSKNDLRLILPFCHLSFRYLPHDSAWLAAGERLS